MNYSIILSTLSICIWIYFYLLFFRILCTWFRPSIDGKLWHYLCLITGPYLALFKGIKFLRRGKFDFTPVLALSILALINQIIQKILEDLIKRGGVSIWFLLAIITESIWNIIFFIIIFFLILCIIRSISIVFHVNESHSVLKVIDLAILPIITIVMKIITKKLEYVKLVFVTMLFLASLLLLGVFVFSHLIQFLMSIPI